MERKLAIQACTPPACRLGLKAPPCTLEVRGCTPSSARRTLRRCHPNEPNYKIKLKLLQTFFLVYFSFMTLALSYTYFRMPEQ
jgi:hypothetical protein